MAGPFILSDETRTRSDIRFSTARLLESVFKPLEFISFISRQEKNPITTKARANRQFVELQKPTRRRISSVIGTSAPILTNQSTNRRATFQ